jgi:hypothetical protein
MITLRNWSRPRRDLLLGYDDAGTHYRIVGLLKEEDFGTYCVVRTAFHIYRVNYKDIDKDELARIKILRDRGMGRNKGTFRRSKG